MCKLHGVRLIKGIKIFESMLKIYIITSENKTAESKSQHQLNWSIIITINSKKTIMFCVFCE